LDPLVMVLNNAVELHVREVNALQFLLMLELNSSGRLKLLRLWASCGCSYVPVKRSRNMKLKMVGVHLTNIHGRQVTHN
jgi:hypothetical protein